MFKKLSETFTATHLVAMFGIAVLAPGAVYAVTESNVVITDAKSGATASVGVSHNLNVYDPIAGYANNPANYVKITGDAMIGNNIVYTVPAGKALIVKAVNFTYYNGTSGSDNYLYVQDGATFIAGFDDPNAVGTHNADLGNGFFVTDSLSTVASDTPSSDIIFSIEGYLVPSTAVPQANSEAAAQQSVRVGRNFVKR